MASWRSIKIDLDEDGMDSMLSSMPVKQVLQEKGNDVKDIALAIMPEHHTGKLDYQVDTDVRPWYGKSGDHRAMTFVRTKHMLGPAIERKYGPLRLAARQVFGKLKTTTRHRTRRKDR